MDIWERQFLIPLPWNLGSPRGRVWFFLASRQQQTFLKYAEFSGFHSHEEQHNYPSLYPLCSRSVPSVQLFHIPVSHKTGTFDVRGLSRAELSVAVTFDTGLTKWAELCAFFEKANFICMSLVVKCIIWRQKMQDKRSYSHPKKLRGFI